MIMRGGEKVARALPMTLMGGGWKFTWDILLNLIREGEEHNPVVTLILDFAL